MSVSLSALKASLAESLDRLFGEPDVADVHVNRVIDDDERRQRAMVQARELMEGTDAPTGVIVALWVPPDVASAIAVEGGELPEQLHLTLAFCGTTDELDEVAIAKVITTADQIAHLSDPVAVRLSGLGQFFPDGETETCHYASVDGAALGTLRTSVVDWLAQSGVEISRKHGFTPHITLRYGGEVPTLEPTEFRFDALTVAVGGKRIDLPFAGGEVYASTLAEPQADPEVALSEFAWGVPLELGEGQPIQIMKTGTFKHPQYGEFSITPQTLTEIVRNFNDRVRGQDIPIDLDHEHKEAVGWIRSLTIQDGDKLFAVPDWTPRGEELVGSGQYRYFSPHYGPYEHQETGQRYGAVLMSGAITNFPFLKDMEPVALSEFAARERPTEEEPMADATKIDVQLSEEAQQLLTEVTARAEAAEKALAERDTQAQAREQELTERLARIERDSMVRRLTERVRGSGDPAARLIGNEEQIVTFAVKLAETFGEDSEEVKYYLSEKAAETERLRQSGLFTEVGSSGAGKAPTAGGEFDQAVEKALSEGRAQDRPAAILLVAREQPKLYKQYDEEQKARARGL